MFCIVPVLMLKYGRAASEKHENENRIKTVVKLASTVEELVQAGGSNILADYVVIFIDTKEGNNILRIEKFLKSIKPMFVSTRLCIVNGTCRSGLLSAAKDLIALADQFRIPVVNAEVADDLGCQQVAEKVIRLGGIASGVYNRMPVVIPTPPDFPNRSSSSCKTI
ncbi:hypothetical protein GE061_007288 [Apolygus lucorum]|uniref:Uncharacterized protein n=1 Tax=Apolygus lucorum TaxID=248454 RepID=A0A6A4IT59_APOLU|nr:hypothetical protein GE061_007288 [Apolygus lucorum]